MDCIYSPWGCKELDTTEVKSLAAGFIGWLPLIAAGLFTWFLDTKSEARLKIVILITTLMWLIYDLHYRNYVAATFDVMTFASNLIGFFMVRKVK